MESAFSRGTLAGLVDYIYNTQLLATYVEEVNRTDEVYYEDQGLTVIDHNDYVLNEIFCE